MTGSSVAPAEGFGVVLSAAGVAEAGAQSAAPELAPLAFGRGGSASGCLTPASSWCPFLPRSVAGRMSFVSDTERSAALVAPIARRYHPRPVSASWRARLQYVAAGHRESASCLAYPCFPAAAADPPTAVDPALDVVPDVVALQLLVDVLDLADFLEQDHSCSSESAGLGRLSHAKLGG